MLSVSGVVYEITPVLLLYDRDPVALIDALALAVVWNRFVDPSTTLSVSNSENENASVYVLAASS